MSEFSDRPFLAGTLTGLRAFSVDEYGRLHGVIHTRVFKPGVNEAVCDMTPWEKISHRLMIPPPASPHGPVHRFFTAAPTAAAVSSAFASTAPAVTNDEDEHAADGEAAEAEPKKHRVGQKHCACGYYAYFDGTNQYADVDEDISTAIVEAIIAGHGTCTVGTRGFRASKAQLVALIAPTRPHRNRFDRIAWRIRAQAWRWEVLGLGILIANAVPALIHLFGGPQIVPWYLSWVAIVVGLGMSQLGARAQWLARRYPPTSEARAARTAERFDLVARNYPGVPIYPSRAEAVAAHPLSVPPTPGPDDPDFWERH